MWFSKQKSVWVRGEDAAARLLKRSGYQIISRNLRLQVGEIDLLCKEHRSGTIVIVEVKARLFNDDSRVRIDPTANIGAQKQAKLRTLAKAIKKRPEYKELPIRIDAIGVIFAGTRKKHVEIKHYISAVGAI
ncbi:MAG: YraN family protein [Phycisphaerales bacterium]|nr:YraN family protein [Phycisphaerales bacterium]